VPAPCKTAPVTAEDDGSGRLKELEARLAALRTKMEAGLPARARELRDWISRLAEPDAAVTIERIAHKLRGVAGTHGHAALGEKAAEVERLAQTRSPDLVAAAADLADQIDIASRAPAHITTPGGGVAITRCLAGLRIAALDDDEATRRLLQLSLGSIGGAEGHVVSHASSLEAFVRERGRVDLVIVDAMMPDASGLEVMERVRALQPDQRFAVLSAASAEELGWRVPDAAWLRKPFRPSELVQAIAKIVGREVP
jgi:CheY-like chemotaxis protein